MAKAFRESHEAYENGDRALAKELSNKGKDHQRKMEQLNKQASDYIFVGPSFSLFVVQPLLTYSMLYQKITK